MTDQELIRRYADHEDQDAFEEVVRRHVAMIYAFARRQVGEGLASDVTQTVFLVLSRKAGSLRQDVVLSAWLFRTACFVVAQARRARARQVRRELEAAMIMNPEPTPPNPRGEDSAETLERHLDDALAALPEKERRYIMTRFFERQKFGEIALRFGVSEDAAKKRVGRALERMRGFLSRRGVAVSPAVLANALNAPPAEGVPAGLVSAISGRMARRGGLSSDEVAGGREYAEWASHVERAMSGAKLAGLTPAGWVGALAIVMTVAVVTLSWVDRNRSEGSEVRDVAQAEGNPPWLNTLLSMRARRAGEPGVAREASRLEIRLLDAATDAPVGFARVVESRQGKGSVGVGVTRTHVSDEQGRCVISVADHDFETFKVSVVAPGFARVGLKWQDYEFDRPFLQHVCRLRPGITLSGRVIALSSAAPVRGTTVSLRMTSDYHPSSREDGAYTVSTTTDGAGVFRFDNVLESTPPTPDPVYGDIKSSGPGFEVRIEHSEFAPEHAGFAGTYEWNADAVFILNSGILVRGVVQDKAGAPISGARVSRDRSVRSDSTGRAAHERAAVTDDNGRFELPHVGWFPGKQLPPVTVIAPGFIPYVGEILDPGSRLLQSGAFDSFGRLIRSPWEGLHWAGEGPPPQISHTNAWSGLHFPAVDELDDKGTPRVLRMTLVLTGTNELPELTSHAMTSPSRDLRVVGRVVDEASGAPVPRFRVLMLKPNTHGARELIGEGGNGKFDWDLGRRWVEHAIWEVNANGYLPAEPESVREDGDTRWFEFKLRTEAALAGWVELPDTRPAVGAQVAMLGDGTHLELRDGGEVVVVGDAARSTTTAKDGSFKVRRTAGARGLMIIHTDGCALFPLERGLTTIIRLDPWSLVEGILLENGGARSDTEVWMRSGEEAGNDAYEFAFQTRTDAHGRFVFRQTPPGRHTITAGDAATMVTVGRRGQPLKVTLNAARDE